MTNRNAPPAGLWRRTTKVLGKLWQGVINLPDRPTQRQLEEDYPRFPWF